MNFLCIYLGEKGGGGCTNACICMGTHSQPLLQNRLMDVYEKMFLPYLPRADPGRGKIGHRGPFLQKTSSVRKATATN